MRNEFFCNYRYPAGLAMVNGTKEYYCIGQIGVKARLFSRK
jgi:hypothetical protein